MVGALLNTVELSAANSGRWLLSSDQFVNLECTGAKRCERETLFLSETAYLECTGAKRCERETDVLSVYFWCRQLVLLFTG